MRRVTVDPSEVRRWAEGRDARPFLGSEGRLTLALPGAAPRGVVLRWEEFAGLFTVDGLAFAWDDEPGSRWFAIGPEGELRQAFEPSFITGPGPV